MRLTLLLLGTLIAVAACAAPPSAPELSDAQRCARFGGYWTAWGVCQGGN